MADPLDPGPAVLLAARELLALGGHSDVAELIEAAELEPAGSSEVWHVGSREVDARPFALVVDPVPFAALGDAARFTLVHEAIRSTMRSPKTELARLLLVVRLPGIGRTWGQVYRSVTPEAAPERPSDEAVLAGALELAKAFYDSVAHDVLASSVLESADAASSGERALRRYVLHVPAPLLVRVEKNRDLSDRIRRIIEHAATRAVEAVADVEIRLRLSPS